MKRRYQRSRVPATEAVRQPARVPARQLARLPAPLPARLLAVTIMAWLAAGACSARSTSRAVPTLPGDGTANIDQPGHARPADAASAAPDPWAGRDDLITAPAPAPAAVIDLPPSQRFTLPSGLEVIVLERKGLPLVEMQLAIMAGRAQVARDRMGLERFAASMLSRGTRSRDARTIAQSIDRVGGTLSTGAGFEATLVSCRVLTGNLGTCLSLVPDVVVNPTFPAAEMERVRQELRAFERQRRDDAGQMASAHFQNLLWGDDHVRGWLMSPRTLDAIERKDLQDWHRSWFLPNNAVLVVVGDVDAKALRPRLEQAFRTWRRGKLPALSKYAEPRLEGIRVRLVDMPGQTQTHIHLGHLGLPHRAPDFFDAVVFNYVLGGGAFSSRLLSVVRSQAGKSYRVSSYFDQQMERGSFGVSTFTRNAEALATVELMLREIAGMRASGPTEDEVQGAITYLAGSYATGFEAVSDIAGALLHAELHDLGDDYVRNYPLSIAAVTAESARKSAAARLDPARFALVLVGDARELEPQLARAGLTYDKVGHLEPIAAYERAGGDGDAAPASAEARAAGKALLAKALQAKGGRARLSRIKSLTMSGTGAIRAGSQEIPATLTRRYLAPDKLRLDVDIRIPGGTASVVTVLAGDKAWNKQPPPAGLMELPPDAVAELQKQVWRDQELILLRASQDSGVEVVAMGARRLGDATYDVLRIVRSDGEVSATLYLDPKTHLLRAMTYDEQGSQTVERYDDYKRVDGIQVAHRRQTQSPDATLDVTVTEVRFNEAMGPALFEQP